MENRELKCLRGDRSRADVAKELGITPQCLGMIERGKRIPRPGLMLKIANYYGQTVDSLFFNANGHKTCQKPTNQNTG